MTTKQQEREALAKIQKIIAGLGEDSYIGTALDGCLEIAEQNIENDWACSMKQKVDSAENQILVLQVDRDAWKATAQDLQNNVKKLQKDLETCQLRVDAAEREYQEMTVEYMKATDRINALEKASKAKAVSRSGNASFEYDNVVSITGQNVGDIGYCKRILLDNGMAIDCWAQDWKVYKLDWVEV